MEVNLEKFLSQNYSHLNVTHYTVPPRMALLFTWNEDSLKWYQYYTLHVNLAFVLYQLLHVALDEQNQTD